MQAALAAGSGIGAAANAAAPVQQLFTAAQVWSRWQRRPEPFDLGEDTQRAEAFADDS